MFLLDQGNLSWSCVLEKGGLPSSLGFVDTGEVSATIPSVLFFSTVSWPMWRFVVRLEHAAPETDGRIGKLA